MAQRRTWVGTCQSCEGCILPDGHRGKHKLGDMEEEEYEVEDIVAERVQPGGACAHLHRAAPRLHVPNTQPWHRAGVEYLVTWKGWPAEDCTWEPEASLAGCKLLLKRWRSAQQKLEATAPPTEPKLEPEAPKPKPPPKAKQAAPPPPAPKQRPAPRARARRRRRAAERSG